LKLAVRATWNDPIGIAWSKIGNYQLWPTYKFR